MKQIGDKMPSLISSECDLLAFQWVVYLFSYISTKYDIPMIMVRDTVKEYGTSKQIEGKYNKKINA